MLAARKRFIKRHINDFTRHHSRRRGAYLPAFYATTVCFPFCPRREGDGTCRKEFSHPISHHLCGLCNSLHHPRTYYEEGDIFLLAPLSLYFSAQKPIRSALYSAPHSLALTIFVICWEGGKEGIIPFCAFKLSQAPRMCALHDFFIEWSGARSNPRDSKPWNCLPRRGRHSPIFHPPACRKCKRALLSSLPLLMAAICLWRLLPRRADYDIRAAHPIVDPSAVIKVNPRTRLR